MQTLNLEAPKMRPYGQRVGNLTRFGETWLNLDQISVVNFEPEDGCDGEVEFENGNSIHLGAEDKECLRAYLTGFESIKRRVNETMPAAADLALR